MMNLTFSNGKIMNRTSPYSTVPIALVGGQFHPFSENTLGVRAMLNSQNAVLYKNAVNATDQVCPGAQQGGKEVSWGSWNELFTSMNNTHNNFLRVFLSGGTAMRVTCSDPQMTNCVSVPTDISPFRRVGGKYDVRSVMEAPAGVDAFNVNYFNVLRDFAYQADQHNIALQLCLFNYYDFSNDNSEFFQAWPQSFWNPAATTDLNWGNANLVNVTSGTLDARNAYFTNTSHTGLMNVQRKFVARVLAAVEGRGNIILEIMNEPRGATSVDRAKWYSMVASWISGHLLSVNATPGTDGKFDVDTWKSYYPPIPLYDRLALISYHGLTGGPDLPTPDVCGTTRNLPPVDIDHINARITTHQQTHPGKALIFSTDAVHHLTHLFNNIAPHPSNVKIPPIIDMHKRDGQITTKLSNQTPGDAANQRRLSDLNNWAYWCLSRALKPATAVGTIHFQNISSYMAAFQSIGDAYNEVLAT